VKPQIARSGFQTSLLFLQLLLCTKNKFLATSTLVSLLMKAGVTLNVFWQGISKPLLRVDSALLFKRLYCAIVWLSLFPGNSVSCYKINCSFLVTLRLHSWYCAKLDQPKINLVWPCAIAKLELPINSQN